MGKDKGVPAAQGRLDKFARPLNGDQSSMNTPDPKDPPSTDNQILAAISDLRTSIEGRIGDLRTDISLIRQDLRNTVDRVTETEGRVSEMEDSQRSYHTESEERRVGKECRL